MYKARGSVEIITLYITILVICQCSVDSCILKFLIFTLIFSSSGSCSTRKFIFNTSLQIIFLNQVYFQPSFIIKFHISIYSVFLTKGILLFSGIYSTSKGYGPRAPTHRSLAAFYFISWKVTKII